MTKQKEQLQIGVDYNYEVAAYHLIRYLFTYFLIIPLEKLAVEKISDFSFFKAVENYRIRSNPGPFLIRFTTDACLGHTNEFHGNLTVKHN